MPYPFNYFASIFNFRSSFANRKKLSWFQMIFTSFFLISITLLPVALQNAQLKTYPLTTFVSDVFDPLSPPAVKPETKFFCRKKNKIQIGTAIKIAPAAKKAIF